MSDTLSFPFELDRPLLFFDLETTGLDPQRDRIVELALIRLSPEGDILERVRRFNPGIPIPPAASAVHGIRDADVVDEPPFARVARSLADLMAPCDLAGFNIRRFDLPLLLAEFRRAGVDFSTGERRLIDSQIIFHREEPRDLSAAARLYLGREHEGAHTALGDIRMTAQVLTAQLDRYPHLPRTMDQLHAYCDASRPFRSEVERWFVDPDGASIFRKGKFKGRPLLDVLSEEPDYLRWMVGAEGMSDEVRAKVEEALRNAGEADPPLL